MSFILPISLIASSDVMKAKMVQDLNAIKNTFDTQYAPFLWKYDYAGWRLEEETSKTKQAIQLLPNPQIKEYQRLLKRFFLSMNDYHVSVQFYSTEASHLPFTIKSAHGRYFITSVDRGRFGKDAPKVGDELVLFEGKDIKAYMDAFRKAEFGDADTATDRSLSEQMLTLRMGSLGFKVPKGEVSFVVISRGKKNVVTIKTSWIYQPEKVKNIQFDAPPAKGVKRLEPPFIAEAPAEIKFPLNQNPILNKEMVLPIFAKLKGVNLTAASEKIGERDSFLPALGKKIWETSSNSRFDAYVFENEEGRRVGFLRIPHYGGDEEFSKSLEPIIAKLQAETEGLIIDQLNNPGGFLFYMYSVVSMFSDKPLIVPTHRVSITQKEVVFALEALESLESITTDQEARDVIGDTLDGLPVTKKTAEEMVAYFHSLLNEWGKGHTLTEPEYFWGFKTIPPCKTHYTKPILLLVNELDFSCGDFFPAILQDNGRAKIFGTKTAGAGGCLLSTEYPNLFGVESYSYTGSIAARIDDHPIENLGVTPDIPYELTEEDVRGRYGPYVKKVLEEMKKLLP